MEMSSSHVHEAAGAGACPDIPFGEKIEDALWLKRPDHPLMNDLILKRVFGHVRRYDLKHCRRVCKKWNQHAIPHMLATFQVTIQGNNSKEKNTETHRIVDFVKLFKSNELGIPFEKYQLGGFNAPDGPGKEFLQICGDSIKELIIPPPYCDRTIENLSVLLKVSLKLEALTLCGRFVSRSGYPVKLFPHSTPALSALKKLILKLNSRKSAIKYCPTLFDELLSVAGNISHIAIHDIDHEGNPENVITLVLDSIEKLGKESSIQSLSLDPFSFQHIEILNRMAEKPNGLKLKEINIESDFCTEENSDPTVDIQLATIFKDTLKDFIGSNGHVGANLMDFPRMPNLKSCKLFIKVDLDYTPVNLNQMFPVIETLNIAFHYTTDDSVELFSQFQVCPTIRTLILAGDITSIPTFHILRVFPNLKKLTLRIAGKGAEQVLLQIWAGMTQLESLSLNGFIHGFMDVDVMMKLDSLVTGISIEGLNQIRLVIPDLEKMTMEKRREKILNLVEEHKTQQPSIRDLTNLRHLKLSITGMKWKDRLSDLTGYLGIYLLKHLIHLDIQFCEFTKTCCEILTRETGVEAWRFQTIPTQAFEPIIPGFQVSILN